MGFNGGLRAKDKINVPIALSAFRDNGGFIYLLKAYIIYSPVNRTGPPQGFKRRNMFQLLRGRSG